MHTEDDSLESIFESLETPTAEQMFDSVREPHPKRPRMNTHIATPHTSIVENLPIHRPPPPYGIISASISTLSLMIFCFLMLTREPVCMGCTYTTLLGIVFAFWLGFLSAIRVNAHQ